MTSFFRMPAMFYFDPACDRQCVRWDTDTRKLNDVHHVHKLQPIKQQVHHRSVYLYLDLHHLTLNLFRLSLVLTATA
jgi:predicted RNA-binding protein with PUA-like domain